MHSFHWSDLLSFEKTVTPKIIKLLYWVGLIAIALFVISSLLAGLAAMRYSFSGGIGAILVALIGGVSAILSLRIACEMCIIFFGVYDRLGEIREALKKQG